MIKVWQCSEIRTESQFHHHNTGPNHNLTVYEKGNHPTYYSSSDHDLPMNDWCIYCLLCNWPKPGKGVTDITLAISAKMDSAYIHDWDQHRKMSRQTCKRECFMKPSWHLQDRLQKQQLMCTVCRNSSVFFGFNDSQNYPHPITAEINVKETLKFPLCNRNSCSDGAIAKRSFMAVMPLHHRLWLDI